MEIKDKLKKTRAKLGLSQLEFATLYNIPKATYQEWEQGRRKPPEYITAQLFKLIEQEEHIDLRFLESEEELH